MGVFKTVATSYHIFRTFKGNKSNFESESGYFLSEYDISGKISKCAKLCTHSGETRESRSHLLTCP